MCKNKSQSALQKNSSSSCIDWILLTDLDSNYCIPIHITFTQLKPDITIFSNILRKFVLIELRYPCEQNMKSKHSTKINKYLAIKSTVECHGWSVELFAADVGATGFCSLSLFCIVS